MAEISKKDETSVEIDERVPLIFNTQLKRLVCIEYPGYVEDITKALKTLGGEKQVDTVLKDPLRRVGLHYRPNDPYCRQGYGDRFPVTDLLMKVKRKKRKKNGTEDVKYECEILGVIDTVVKFKALADFQYLAPNIPDLVEGLRGSEILEIETPLHLPPAAFCRVDHPFDYNYRPDPVRKGGGSQAGQTQQLIGQTARKPRPSNAIFCHFKTPKIPNEARESALKELQPLSKETLEKVKHLFNLRPIWSRRALLYHIGEKPSRITPLLACIAYYWVGGPWRTLYTKFGYDPRNNPAAKIYQKLDFRLRNKKALRGMKLPPVQRSPHDFNMTTRYQKIRVSHSIVPLGVSGNSSRRSDNTSEKAGTSSEKHDSSCRNSEDSPETLPYVFYPDRPPTTRQSIYQLCDIRCSKIQSLISANDGQERECHETEGWLEPGTKEKIREIMTNSLIELNRKLKAGEEGAGTLFAGDEQSADIEEEEASFLDSLMDDNDVETYELLDEDF